MKVLVACEFSGIVRDAFRKEGHQAWSCDFLPSERPGPHITGDVRPVLFTQEWDMMIGFPPCTHLAVSGARWFREKKKEQKEALGFWKEPPSPERWKNRSRTYQGIAQAMARQWGSL